MQKSSDKLNNRGGKIIWELRYAGLTVQNALYRQAAKAAKAPRGIHSAVHVCWHYAVKTKAVKAAAMLLTAAAGSKNGLLQSSMLSALRIWILLPISMLCAEAI